MLFDEFGGEAGFKRNLFYKFFVIKWDPELFRDKMTDGTTAAAKLTADCNDVLLHETPSFIDSKDIIAFIMKIVKGFVAKPHKRSRCF